MSRLDCNVQPVTKRRVENRKTKTSGWEDYVRAVHPAPDRGCHSLTGRGTALWYLGGLVGTVDSITMQCDYHYLASLQRPHW